MIRNYRAINDLDAVHQAQHKALFDNCFGIIEKVFTEVPIADQVPPGYCALYQSGSTQRLYVNINGTLSSIDFGDLSSKPTAILDTDGALTANSDDRVASQKATKTYADTKQSALVSGTNIKTVNGNSLLGSGDLTVATQYAAGSTALITANTERNTTSTTYAKLKEIYLAYGGVVSTTFDLKKGNEGDAAAYGRIYIDGVAAGTERSRDNVAYQTFTEDITVTAGCLIQLYAKIASGTAYVQNFQIKVAKTYITAVNTD
jgi:hypothetical protein